MAEGRLVLLLDFDWLPWRRSLATPALLARVFEFSRQKGWIVTFRVSEAAIAALPVLGRAIRDEGHVLSREIDPGQKVLAIEPSSDLEQLNAEARQLIAAGYLLTRD